MKDGKAVKKAELLLNKKPCRVYGSRQRAAKRAAKRGPSFVQPEHTPKRHISN
jgi:hypothetical protein